MRFHANYRNIDVSMVPEASHMTFTVAVSYVKGLIAAFERIGLNREALLGPAGITHDLLSIPENRVNLSQLKSLLSSVVCGMKMQFLKIWLAMSKKAKRMPILLAGNILFRKSAFF